tara:strand:+ start:170 stop:694 length:525 start_codon:yes stop_codon:yes gene_type:complete
MKKLGLIFGMIVLTLSMNAQENELKLSPLGFEALVNNINGKTSNELYETSLDWIGEYYENPDEVLKSSINGEKIRLNGVAFVINKGMQTYTMRYTIELLFKEGRYKFDLNIKNFLLTPSGMEVSLKKLGVYNKDGSVHKRGQKWISAIEVAGNLILKSYHNYLTGATSKSEDDW